jgi:hypothetical protein
MVTLGKEDIIDLAALRCEAVPAVADLLLIGGLIVTRLGHEGTLRRTGILSRIITNKKMSTAGPGWGVGRGIGREVLGGGLEPPCRFWIHANKRERLQVTVYQGEKALTFLGVVNNVFPFSFPRGDATLLSWARFFSPCTKTGTKFTK